MQSNNHRISGVTNFLKPPNEPEKKKEQEESAKSRKKMRMGSAVSEGEVYTLNPAWLRDEINSSRGESG